MVQDVYGVLFSQVSKAQLAASVPEARALLRQVLREEIKEALLEVRLQSLNSELSCES